MWSDFRTELWKWALGSGSTAALALATLHMNELLSQNNPAFPEPAVRICIILTSAAVIVMGWVAFRISRNPWIRGALRTAEPYEGIWIERYNVGEDDETNTTMLRPYTTINVVRAKSGTLPNFEFHSFRADQGWRSGYGWGRTVNYDAVNRIADFTYEGCYFDKTGMADGRTRGSAIFAFDLPAMHGVPVSGTGHFMEREVGDVVWRPAPDTVITRISLAEVRRILGQSTPRTVADFHRLAFHPQTQAGA